MDLIFAFDSEDFVTPEAADAEKWWAQELRSRGLRGSFQCVAEMLRSLQRWGRQDVIDALSRHETGYHSNYHSLPPTHAQALEGRTLAEGVEWVLRHEASGLATHMETLGHMPVSYHQPGSSWAPATLLAMGAMGIRVFCGSPFRSAPVRQFWYCGMLTSRYDLRVEKYFGADDSRTGAFKAAFEQCAKEAGENGLMVVFTHPTRLVTRAFWDEQFFGAKSVLPEERLPAPLYTPGEIQTHKDCARSWLDWIQERKDVNFTDYASVYMKHAANRRDLTALLAECRLVPGEEGQLPLRLDDGRSSLPPEVFEELRWEWGPLPADFIGRRLREQARRLAWTAAPAG
jgi:hypothetical protein